MAKKTPVDEILMLKLVSGEIIICKCRITKTGYKISMPMIVEQEYMDEPMLPEESNGTGDSEELPAPPTENNPDEFVVFLIPFASYSTPISGEIAKMHVIMHFEPIQYLKMAYSQYLADEAQKSHTDSTFLERNKRKFGFL